MVAGVAREYRPSSTRICSARNRHRIMGTRMPSFQDSAVIFFIALILFGPKKLPELARQLGKLMGEFRRASNEFRMQMEDELRASDQAEKQKQIAAIEAAAPTPPVLTSGEANTIALPADAEIVPTAETYEDPLDSHPHMPPPDRHTSTEILTPETEPVPIATSGSLQMMPPATGLPAARAVAVSEASALSPIFESIPQAPVELPENHRTAVDEAVTHG